MFRFFQCLIYPTKAVYVQSIQSLLYLFFLNLPSNKKWCEKTPLDSSRCELSCPLSLYLLSTVLCGVWIKSLTWEYSGPITHSTTFSPESDWMKKTQQGGKFWTLSGKPLSYYNKYTFSNLLIEQNKKAICVKIFFGTSQCHLCFGA